mmetsp:Transcript_10627/g.20612  ORF Transcript_10627/g.20612 Transcript_10627/m.20612 type:complete len:89 (+) Transcript_10627:242-508(+)
MYARFLTLPCCPAPAVSGSLPVRPAVVCQCLHDLEWTETLQPCGPIQKKRDVAVQSGNKKEVMTQKIEAENATLRMRVKKKRASHKTM